MIYTPGSGPGHATLGSNHGNLQVPRHRNEGLEIAIIKHVIPLDVYSGMHIAGQRINVLPWRACTSRRDFDAQ